MSFNVFRWERKFPHFFFFFLVIFVFFFESNLTGRIESETAKKLPNQKTKTKTKQNKNKERKKKKQNKKKTGTWKVIKINYDLIVKYKKNIFQVTRFVAENKTIIVEQR